MNVGQAIIEAMESLTANKMRSGLTVLGIVIGVAAVIAMLAVGQGAQETITGSISGIGTNLLFVFQGNQNIRIQNPKDITLSDMQAIADKFAAPDVQDVSAVIQGSVNVTFGGESATTTVNGITPNYQSMRSYELSEGSLMTEEHILSRSSVAIIGAGLAEKLFDRTEGIIGETIRIEGQPFRVLGVLVKKGGSAFGGEDDIILVPFDTAQVRILRRWNPEAIDLLMVQSTSAETVQLASDQVSEILRARHQTRIGEDDFTVFSQNDIVNTAQTITGVLTIFLGGIAGISLLVGGIGIMNIMLVSVTERTREIGLRKALGARKRDILTQFLTESSLLSLFGGIIGILLGYLIAVVVGQIAAASGTPLNPKVGLDSILLATLFSTAVGLFFGLYPANRAAGLAPVEALRYE
jgi:putative ABC transport system permease protein